MAHLGEFGRAVEEYEATAPEEPDTFGFCGATFEVPRLVSDLPLMAFCAAVKTAQRDVEDAAAEEARAEAAAARAHTPVAVQDAADTAMAAQVKAESANTLLAASAYEFIRKAIGESQWTRFEATAEKAGASREELMGLAAQIYAHVAARPTQTRSLSTRGPSSTGDGSTDGSGSPAATPGPSQPGTDSNVVLMPELSPAARQAAEMRALMVPAAQLLASGG